MIESESIEVMIPKDNYQVVEFVQEELPGIAIVNKALKSTNLKKVFSCNCSILIELKNVTENGLPVDEELKILDDFECLLNENSKGVDKEKPNALFFGRVTWNSTRQLIWKVYAPRITNDFLVDFIDSGNYPREFDFKIEYDDNWELTDWYFNHI